MDKNNYNHLYSGLAKSNEDRKKIKLILNEINPKNDLSVPDPYYGGNDGFKNVYTILNDACDQIIEVIPLAGPSSIILALMASGLNGQSFTFIGYLPIDKKRKNNCFKKN